jgi:hypothetical protein
VRRKDCLKYRKWRNILQKIKMRKCNRIGHILCRNCRLKHVIEGKTEGSIKVMGRRGRRRKQLMEDRKKRRGYYKLNEGTRYCALWVALFGKGYRPVVRQKNKIVYIQGVLGGIVNILGGGSMDYCE